MKFRYTVSAVALISIVFYLCQVSLIWYVLLILLGFFILLLGVINIQWNYFLKAFHKSENTEKIIILTFDDGPHPKFTPQVLDLLRKNQIKATFFCIGKNVVKYPGLVKQITEEGHSIGNHSFSHSGNIDFNFSEKWKEEIEKTDQAVRGVTGIQPLFFRPPYGITTPHLAHALKKTGHKVIGWSVRPYDTVDQLTEKIIYKIKSRTKAGDIILLHDTHSRIIPVLQEIIPYFQNLGYSFSSMEELFISIKKK